MREFFVCCFATMVTLASVRQADGALTAHTPPTLDYILSWSGGPNDRTWGWRFSTDREIEISAFGYYDHQADGLRVAHEVGIWQNNSTNQLASVTIGRGFIGEYIDGFRYIDLETPLRLEPGSYIFASSGGNDIDGRLADNDARLLGEGLTYGNRVQLVSSNLIRPLWISPSTAIGEPRIPFHPVDGGNFRYTIIPEPTVPILCLLAASGYAMRRERR